MLGDSINFSLWCDFIERDFLDGKFKELLESGVIKGATSNPAIFEQAFSKSNSYKSDIEKLKKLGFSPKEIYEELACGDIKNCAKLLRPLYDKGIDGFVSIEVDPFLADFSEATYLEGKRLFQKIDEPNVMIKVPATDAGYKAMEKLLSDGISVNATLIFNLEQAKNVLNAFENGIKNSKQEVFGVISIFVSRFDRKIDPLTINTNLSKSKVGIMNALLIYNEIEKRGLKNIKSLFASTGVKGNGIKPSYYVDELLLKNSINTAPVETVEAFIKENNFNPKESINSKAIESFFGVFKDNGIDINAISNELLKDGLIAFEDSFERILEGL